MGRGRAKAKQQKVARELKYNTHSTDFDALQRELGMAGPHEGPAHGRGEPDPAEADDDYGEYEDWTGTGR